MTPKTLELETVPLSYSGCLSRTGITDNIANVSHQSVYLSQCFAFDFVHSWTEQS